MPVCHCYTHKNDARETVEIQVCVNPDANGKTPAFLIQDVQVRAYKARNPKSLHMALMNDDGYRRIQGDVTARRQYMLTTYLKHTTQQHLSAALAAAANQHDPANWPILDCIR